MSWIVTDNATGQAVLETFSDRTARLINLHSATHTAQEAGEYLANLNASLRTDPGPDGLAQLVVPGAERISDRQLAERKMQAPKRSATVQREPGPLFSDTVRNQLSLF